MKRIALTTLSLALIGAASAAHAQSSVTLYGIIDTSITYVNHASGNLNQWSVSNSNGGDLSSSRWGLKGQEDLGGGLAAIFQLENGFDPGTGKFLQGGAMFGRQAYVGLQSNQYGTVTLGRQYDPVVDLVQPITEDDTFGSVFATAGDVDNYDNSSRTNNAVKYLSPNFGGLQVEGMYAFGGVAGSTGSEQTWAVAAAYNRGPLSVAGGYFVADNSNTGLVRTTWTSTSGGTFDSLAPANSLTGNINSGFATAKSINIGRIAAQYVISAFTVGAAYSNSQYKADGYSLFGSTEKYNTGQAFLNYQAAPALLLGVGYSYTKASGETSATYNQVSVGADYSLSKRTDIYLVGAWQHASGDTIAIVNGAATVQTAQASVGSYGYNGTDTQTIVSAGLRVKF
jgi:predicted porin